MVLFCSEKMQVPFVSRGPGVEIRDCKVTVRLACMSRERSKRIIVGLCT
jgi:hypothetical protein